MIDRNTLADESQHVDGEAEIQLMSGTVDPSGGITCRAIELSARGLTGQAPLAAGWRNEGRRRSGELRVLAEAFET